MPMSLEILQQQASYKSVFRIVNSAVTVARLLLRAVLRPCAAAASAVQQSIDISWTPTHRAHSSKPAARCCTG